MIFIILIIIVYILCWITMLYQANAMNKDIINFKKNYPNHYISIGRSKKIFSKGEIVILAINKDGIIENCLRMRGRTIFAKFQPYDNLNKKSIYEINFNNLSPAFKNCFEYIDEKLKGDKNEISL